MMTKTKTGVSNYKIEGTGRTIGDADSDFELKRQNLVAELERGNTSDSVGIMGTGARFIGEYSLKGGVDPTSVPLTKFRVESGKGWDDLWIRARRVADLGLYDPQYIRQDFVGMTGGQVDVVTGVRPPTAGYERRAVGGGDRFSRVFG